MRLLNKFAKSHGGLNWPLWYTRVRRDLIELQKGRLQRLPRALALLRASRLVLVHRLERRVLLSAAGRATTTTMIISDADDTKGE